jgi:hypothetical protein
VSLDSSAERMDDECVPVTEGKVPDIKLKLKSFLRERYRKRIKAFVSRINSSWATDWKRKSTPLRTSAC